MALRAKTQQVTRPVHGLSPMARAHAEGQGLPDFYGTGEDDLKTANVFTVSCYAARAQYLVTLHGLACKRQESPKVGQPTAIRPREPFKLAKRVALGSQRVHREFTGGSQRVHRRFATHQAVVVDSRTPKPIRQTPASFDAMRLTIGLRAKTSPYCQALIAFFLNTQYSQSPPVSGACGTSRILRIFSSTGSIETSHWAVEQTGFNPGTSKVA